jgi:HlyD family secretion protein
VQLSNPRGELISGIFAYVQLETGRLANRIVVPADAVLVRQGRDLVFLVKDSRAQWTYVTVGRRSGDLIEITDPIAPGDSVAVAGHHALSHDARVEIGDVVSLDGAAE